NIREGRRQWRPRSGMTARRQLSRSRPSRDRDGSWPNAGCAYLLKDPCNEITQLREKAGQLLIDTAGGILDVADSVLSSTFDLVGLAAPLQLGVAGHLAESLLGRALDLFRGSLDLVQRALRLGAGGKEGDAERGSRQCHWF